ncbi:MAG TPA: hypothetical protein VL651_07130, partial [Bacteroidia bacterium]|nr:hypothetical protein [Bacteroidia bacterium]
MKKTLLSSVAVAICVSAFAQITVTSADVAPIYTVAIQANDTTPTVTLGSAGTSQAWDYSALNDQRHDTITFTLPQFTPLGSSFPMSNLAAVNGSGNAANVTYLKNSASMLEIWGEAADPFGTGNMAIPFNNSETFLTFPSTYNTAFTDTATALVQMYYGQDPGIGFTVDSFRIHIWVKKTSVNDGWGTITTPSMNTLACIRQNILRVEADTVDIYAFGNWAPDFFDQLDSNRLYDHWANGAGFPVCELTDYQDQGVITSATYLLSTSATGIAEANNAAEVKAYPVPANDALTITFKGNVSLINVYDMNGRIVSSGSVYGN